MPSLLFAIPKWFRLPKHIRNRLSLLSLIFLPMSIGVLMVGGQVWRYQLEVWLAALFILIPTLWYCCYETRPLEAGLHWVSSFMAGAMSLASAYWIVSTRISQL